MSEHFEQGTFDWYQDDRMDPEEIIPLAPWQGGWNHPDPEHWNKIRKAVFERDGHRCVACNENYRIAPHHRDYVRWGRELVEDAYTFCRRCHKKIHGIGKDRRAA